MINRIKNIYLKNKTKIILAAGFVAIGILTRTVFHIAPNVEFVTAISLLAGFYLGGIYLFIVPLAVMVGSDMFIGNSNIFVFTWSAYILAGFTGLLLRQTHLNKKVVLSGLGAGVVFSIFFYLYTNFGVWMITPWYEKTFNGLMYSYYMGLPFLRLNIAGNIIIVPALFMIAEFVRQRVYLRQGIKKTAVQKDNQD